jgi:hypothetical protein
MLRNARLVSAFRNLLIIMPGLNIINKSQNNNISMNIINSNTHTMLIEKNAETHI